MSLLDVISAYTHDVGGVWVVKRSFLDEGNQGRKPVYKFTGTSSLGDVLQGFDQKNGIDVTYTAKRPVKEQSMLIVTYGQNYSLSGGTYSTGLKVQQVRDHKSKSVPLQKISQEKRLFYLFAGLKQSP